MPGFKTGKTLGEAELVGKGTRGHGDTGAWGHGAYLQPHDGLGLTSSRAMLRLTLSLALALSLTLAIPLPLYLSLPLAFPFSPLPTP